MVMEVPSYLSSMLILTFTPASPPNRLNHSFRNFTKSLETDIIEFHDISVCFAIYPSVWRYIRLSCDISVYSAIYPSKLRYIRLNKLFQSNWRYFLLKGDISISFAKMNIVVCLIIPLPFVKTLDTEQLTK